MRVRSITPDIDLVTVEVPNDRSYYITVSWGIYSCHYNQIPGYFTSFLLNKHTRARIDLGTSFFFHDDELAILNGENVEIYHPDYTTMTRGEIVRSVPKPSVTFGVMPGYSPILVTGANGQL